MNAIETSPAHGSAAVPLSPVRLLERSALVFGDQVAIVDDNKEFTYAQFGTRSRRLAHGLRDLGVSPGDRVAALCTNSHVMLELHNGVPAASAVLVPMNIRLSPQELVAIVEHSGASLIVATDELASIAQEIGDATSIRVVTESNGYVELLDSAEPLPPLDVEEQALLAINYTSGSTGTPKGVMYNHRGAYLQSLAMAYHMGFAADSAYLWTLPMFHCDGWCHTWAVTAAGSVHVCQRSFDAHRAWSTLSGGSITHLAGAPTVLTMIAHAAEETDLTPPASTVKAATGGAPPTPALLARLHALNIDITHLYGLTETYGPAVINQWKPAWSKLSNDEQALLNARQGVGNIVTLGVRVVDADGHDVPDDGATIGEIVLRGDNVTPGYYRDEAATAAALIDGWLHTGDLAVRYSDGYVEMRDRAKDIVISGGENISSLEVERVICDHPRVLEAAVVARSDEHWGEVPVAFVTVRAGDPVSEAEIIGFVRDRVAHFKAPKNIIFGDLPKTSTGKVQKHLLRAMLHNRAVRTDDSGRE